MWGKVRLGRCGELKVCWGPTPQHISLHLPHYPPHNLPPHANTLPHSPHTLSHTLPTLLHSPHIFPYLPPHPNTFPYISPHTPHISSHSSPDLPLHPNTLPYSPHALSHTSLPTSYPTVSIMWRSYQVTRKADKIFNGNREFKVLFPCRQCKFSMYESVAKLPCGEVTVAKLPCGEVTGNPLSHTSPLPTHLP